MQGQIIILPGKFDFGFGKIIVSGIRDLVVDMERGIGDFFPEFLSERR